MGPCKGDQQCVWLGQDLCMLQVDLLVGAMGRAMIHNNGTGTAADEICGARMKKHKACEITSKKNKKSEMSPVPGSRRQAGG